MLRNLCAFAEVTSFLALEKLIDLETSSVNKIALVFLLQNLIVLLLFICNKVVDKWNKKLVLCLGILSLIVSAVGGDYFPYWVHLNIVFFMSYIVYSIVPATSIYLENMTEKEERSSYLASSSLYRTIFQVATLFLSVYTLSNFLGVRIYLSSAILFLCLTLVSMWKLSSFAPGKTLKTSNWLGTLKVIKYCWKMFLIYGLFCFILRGVILINQQYIKEIFSISGYEFSLPYKGMTYVGGFIASLIITSVVRGVTYKQYSVMSLIVLLLLSVAFHLHSSVLIINCFGFLLGIANYGMSLYFNIEIHKTFRGEDLKNIATLTYLLPFLTAFLSVMLFSVLSEIGVGAMNFTLFIGAIIILFFVLKLKDIRITGVK